MDFEPDRSCVTHHACDCMMARLDLLEATLQRVDDEVGGLKVMVNGVGRTTVRDWLHLPEAINDGK